MSVKNYVYGAMRPTGGLVVIESQFALARQYRNRLVELELRRRAEQLPVLHAVRPELATLHSDFCRLRAEVDLMKKEYRKVNQMLSAEAGGLSGLRAKPSVATTREDAQAYSAACREMRAAEFRYNKAVSDSYRAEDVKLATSPVWEAHYQRQREARRDAVAAGLHWGTYSLVEESAKDFHKGEAPEFRSANEDATDWVAVHLKNKQIATPDQLFACTHTQAQFADVTTPGSRAEAAGRKYVVVRLWVASAGRGKPVMVEIPVHMHRPLPDGCKVSWVRVGRKRVGVGHKWSLMVTFKTEDCECRHADSASDGCVSVHFGAVDCDDGVQVATWVGSDGETGREVIPNESVAGFSIPRELRSQIDVATDVLRERLAEWVAADESSAPLCGLIANRKRVERDGVVVYEAEQMSRVQAAVRLRRWKASERFYRLYSAWSASRFAGDDTIFPAVAEWAKRYAELKYRHDRTLSRNRMRREHQFRNFAVSLRRRYRTFHLHVLAGDDRITRAEPEVKVHGEWRKPADNELKSVASCGRLRAILKESAEVCVEEKPKKPKKATAKRVRRKPKAVSA